METLMRRLSLLLVSALVGPVSLSSNVRAEVRIVVSFTTVQNMVEPEVKTVYLARTTTYTLTSDHILKTNSSMNNAEVNNESELGKPHYIATISHRRAVSRTRIENGVIINVSFFDTYKIIEKIATDGKSTCSASIEYSLLPGQKVYKLYGIQNVNAEYKYTDIRVENVSCEISDIGR